MNVLDEHVTVDRRRFTGGGSDTPYLEWKLRAGAPAVVSARKLAASLWQSAAAADNCGIVWRRRRLIDRLGFESCSSLPIRKFELESATKWNYCHPKASVGDHRHFHSNLKFTLRNQNIETMSGASGRHIGLLKAQKCAKEVESRTKLRQCTKKHDEERASLIRSQHHDSCTAIKYLKDDVKKEKKMFKKINFLNSKLVDDIAAAKLSAMKFKRNFEKEKKARKFLVDLCSDLAKEVEDRKGELGALRKRCGRVQKEMEKERKMLQLGEVWREEMVQMKLVNAKLILEEKYSQMNNLIAEMETFLRSSNLTTRCDNNARDQEPHKSASSEISLISLKQPKGSSIGNTINIKGNGSISNGSISSIISQDCVAVDVDCGWIAPEPRNPHIVRAMKGGIEWPRRIHRQVLRPGRNGLEAKLESQKMILRNVLKHRR